MLASPLYSPSLSSSSSFSASAPALWLRDDLDSGYGRNSLSSHHHRVVSHYCSVPSLSLALTSSVTTLTTSFPFDQQQQSGALVNILELLPPSASSSSSRPPTQSDLLLALMPFVATTM